jgi:hypothetical protein
MAKQYPNRSDLRNPTKKLAAKAAPGQTYGEAGKQIAAQQQIPMAASPQPAVTPPQTAVERPRPGQFGPLDRPTERPDEPLTAGAPFGPGRTTQVSGYAGVRNSDPILDELRALYAAYPSEELADMLDSYLREGY